MRSSGIGVALYLIISVLIRYGRHKDTEKTPCEVRDWKDVATSQGSLGATRSYKSQGRLLCLRPAEGVGPC